MSDVFTSSPLSYLRLYPPPQSPHRPLSNLSSCPITKLPVGNEEQRFLYEMLHSHPWLDPIHRYKSSAPPFKRHKLASFDSHVDLRAYQTTHRVHQRRHDGRPCHLTSYYAEGSEFSDTECDDAYALDTDTTLDSLSRIPYFPKTRHSDLGFASNLKRVQIRMPKHTADQLKNNEILILPSKLTHLRIIIRTRLSKDVMGVAVPGDMRLSQVIDQLLPLNPLSEGCAVHIKRDGGWQEIRTMHKVSDIADLEELGHVGGMGRREAEVRITLESGGERGMRHERRGWEHEIARLERMRVY
ncbi:hypothetical protein EK21DRAFT_90630 [Setomelanomma holmii]|uniref:Uncharacterized protein n=1 Tax=Setomelanomma holmii TaxID=210430 RepID=A0A9P4H6I5_9PLEO|nr:hypothetical protein EK21DRAFT_90630 [Setomelanomma holmii]